MADGVVPKVQILSKSMLESSTPKQMEQKQIIA